MELFVTVIIADDHMHMREIIKKIISEVKGIDRVIECEDGAAAFSSVVNEKADLVLIDLLMKGMDGFTAIKKIRDVNKEVPIIVVTQFPEKEFKEEVLKLGADLFVNKDSLLLLPKAITELLNKTN